MTAPTPTTVHRRTTAGSLLLIAIVLLSGVPAHGAGGVLDVQISQAVQDRVLGGNAARVIVELQLPSGRHVAEGQLAGQAAVTIQRQDISATQTRVIARLQRAAHKVVHRFETIPILVLEVDAAALLELRAAPQYVRRVTDDVLHAPLLRDSVPLIHADQAWARGADGSGFAVAVLDTGVDKTHPFLSGKVVAEACFAVDINGTGWCPNGAASQIGDGAAVPCSYSAECAHGTHVAGIAAGSGAGASVDFSGVARGAKLIAVQVFHPETTPTCAPGEGSPCARAWASDLLRGAEQIYLWRTTYNIAAVNLSLGFDVFSGYCDAVDANTAAAKAAIDNLRSVGIATVAAAGNNGLTGFISAPACISSAISVGATTKADGVSWFSNNASFLSLLAPGGAADGVATHDIHSSVPGTGYDDFAGTSMAAPHVAGAWALLRQAAPNATVDEILGALQRGGRPIVDTRNGITQSRIDAAAALSELTRERAALVSPAPGSTLSGTSVTFSWTPGNGAIQYWLNIGTTVNGIDIYSASQGTDLSRTITGLPSDGRALYVRLWTKFTSGPFVFTDYTFTAFTLVLQPAALTSPSPGSTLPGTFVTFAWSAGTGATQYWLNVGTTMNGVDIYSASQGTDLSRTITGLPADGRTLYVRLWTKFTTGPFVFTDYTFTAFTLVLQPAAVTSPTPGSTLPGTSVTFAWSAGTGATQYWLNVGTTMNGVDIYSASQDTARSRTITGLPADGSTVYVRLWTKFSSGPFVFTDYTFTAFRTVVQPAALTSPTPGSTLPGTSVTFTWSAGTGATQYWLNVGTTVNGVDIYSASQDTALSRTISGLPSDGRTVHLRLWTKFATGPFVFTDYTFTAFKTVAQPAALTSPSPGTLPGTSVTFTWSGGTGAIQYWLNVGTTVNGVDIYSASQDTALSRTITGLPRDGRTVYVRLWTKFTTGGPFVFTDYTFTAFTGVVQPAALTSPSPGSTLPGTTVTFTWSPGSDALQYWLNVGTSVNGVDLYSASQGTTLSQTIAGLPADGRTIFVRLWTRFTPGGPFVFTDYTFTASRVAGSSLVRR